MKTAFLTWWVVGVISIYHFSNFVPVMGIWFIGVAGLCHIQSVRKGKTIYIDEKE